MFFITGGGGRSCKTLKFYPFSVSKFLYEKSSLLTTERVYLSILSLFTVKYLILSFLSKVKLAESVNELCSLHNVMFSGDLFKFCIY